VWLTTEKIKGKYQGLPEELKWITKKKLRDDIAKLCVPNVDSKYVRDELNKASDMMLWIERKKIQGALLAYENHKDKKSDTDMYVTLLCTDQGKGWRLFKKWLPLRRKGKGDGDIFLDSVPGAINFWHRQGFRMQADGDCRRKEPETFTKFIVRGNDMKDLKVGDQTFPHLKTKREEPLKIRWEDIKSKNTKKSETMVNELQRALNFYAENDPEWKGLFKLNKEGNVDTVRMWYCPDPTPKSQSKSKSESDSPVRWFPGTEEELWPDDESV
jgi:hypothetical protein